MKLKSFFISFLLAAIGLARADVAIVVGINDYPAPHKLDACENDALDVAKALHKKGFKLFPNDKPLLSAAATKEAILQALATVKVGPDENFVFYYAGHGYPGDGAQSEPQIIPVNAFPPERPGITATTLYQAIAKVRSQCRTATVILDCCFSGGLSKGASDLRSRCWIPDGSTYSQVAKSMGSEDYTVEGTQNQIVPPRLVSNTKPICYVVAAKSTQESWEAMFYDDYKHHGVFTHYLVPELQAQQEKWGAIQAKVNGEIEAELGKYQPTHAQTPSVTPDFLPEAPFQVLPVKIPNFVPQTVMQQMADEPDSTKIQIAIAPQRRVFHVGEPVQVSLQVGANGYLMVLSKDVQAQRIWPTTPNVDQAEVKAGQTVSLATDQQLERFLYPGDTQVTAIWFKTRKGAKRMMDLIKRSTHSYADLDGPLDPIPAEDAEYKTASLTVTVLTSLVGNFEILDAKALWQQLKGDDYSALIGDRLFSTPPYRTLDFDQETQDQTGLLTLQNELTKRLNQMICGEGDWYDPAWATKLAPTSPNAAILKARKPITDPAISAAILTELFPALIKPAALPQPAQGAAK